MDLNIINDPVTLKALAYDQIASKEQAEANIRAINQRLAEIAQIPPKLTPKEKAEMSGKKKDKTAKKAEETKSTE